jgi:5-methylcytosine-specific restriction endonuclease McrA
MDLVEHIHTRSTGGTNTWDNVTAGCTSCNGMKRNKSLLHALLHINQ